MHLEEEMHAAATAKVPQEQRNWIINVRLNQEVVVSILLNSGKTGHWLGQELMRLTYETD